MSRRPLLLDTCAVIFVVRGAPLTQEAEACLADASATGRPTMVSPITAWELGMLVAKGRLVLTSRPLDWFTMLIARGLELAPMTPDILIASSFLDASDLRDPADRIIAATAEHLDYEIVTRDRPLLNYAAAGHIRAVPC